MIRYLTAALLLTASMTGCAASANAPVTGFVYLSANGATAATSNPVSSKSGKSCASSILGVVGLGDASIAAAAKAGGITRVASVDSENSNILGIYATNCTVVSGE